MCGVCVGVWCVFVWCVCDPFMSHTKISCHTVTCDTKKTKGSEKPKVSSLREKPKASRVHRDHMGYAQQFINSFFGLSISLIFAHRPSLTDCIR